QRSDRVEIGCADGVALGFLLLGNGEHELAGLQRAFHRRDALRTADPERQRRAGKDDCVSDGKYRKGLHSKCKDEHAESDVKLTSIFRRSTLFEFLTGF